MSDCGRLRIHHRVDLPATPEQVFDLLTDHWARLWPVTQRRIRDGADPATPNGPGSVRALRALGIWQIHESIVTHTRPRLIEYRTIRGPVRDHLGRLELTPAPSGGTHLDYRIWFDTAPWIPARLIAISLETTWRLWSVPRLRKLCRHLPGTTTN
ncbi:SRPBCC family protein [Nocardia mexicana]|uniref:Polyketide cyclase/dehydrase/lipid transport protein n=1 Tax=Nocardia mexicana TaxID=279262 RepID=A0A370H8X6_9NOCA|nr:SRPBCC family protein [Nocardia mexicana]RDI50791.1 polyketide cyclase/dehydrase/lipid transport protein [Nocardia mexicana]